MSINLARENGKTKSMAPLFRWRGYFCFAVINALGAWHRSGLLDLGGSLRRSLLSRSVIAKIDGE